MPSDAQTSTKNQTLSDILLADHLLTQEQYNDVRVKSATQNVSDESILTAANYVNEQNMAEAKAKLLGIPFIDLESTSFSPQALAFVSRAVAERFSVVPFMYDDKIKTLSIAMSNPVDLEALSFIRQKTGLVVKSFAAGAMDVAKAINQKYRQEIVG